MEQIGAREGGVFENRDSVQILSRRHVAQIKGFSDHIFCLIPDRADILKKHVFQATFEQRGGQGRRADMFQTFAVFRRRYAGSRFETSV